MTTVGVELIVIDPTAFLDSCPYTPRIGSANSGIERPAGATIELLAALDAATYFPTDRPEPSSPPMEKPPTRSSIRVTRPARPLHDGPLPCSSRAPVSIRRFEKIESLSTPNRRSLLPIRVRASMP